MMGQQHNQCKLFHYYVDLNQRVRSEHPLRKVKQEVDFSFVRREVAALYGYNGNESVDPVVIAKMFFLLFYEDVPSERELMRMIKERLDWLWFLDFDLDDEIPDHSVLSKARKRWGPAVFQRVFVQTVQACVAAGLVDGKKLHVDSSLVAANASRDSMVKGAPEWITALKEAYGAQEKKLDETGETTPCRKDYTPVSDTMMSRSDPDAVAVRHGGEASRPRYKCHRAVDDAVGVITATETTRADVADGVKMMGLIDQHEWNTGESVEAAVGDATYGTTANFRECARRGIESHMSDLHLKNAEHSYRGIFPEESFAYDAESDTYLCPGGQRLRRRKHKEQRRVFEYAAGRKVCGGCPLKGQCTRSAERSVRRHEDHELIEQARAQAGSPAARRSRRRRRHLMEGSFAQSSNQHHFKRARWRRLWRQRIQDYLIAAVQNIAILIQQRAKRQTKLAAGTRAAITPELAAVSHSRHPFAPILAAIRRSLGFLRCLRAPANGGLLPSPV
jgi:transposase